MKTILDKILELAQQEAQKNGLELLGEKNGNTTMCLVINQNTLENVLVIPFCMNFEQEKLSIAIYESKPHAWYRDNKRLKEFKINTTNYYFNPREVQAFVRYLSVLFAEKSAIWTTDAQERPFD